ncbi:unnamed protein product [Closterium sp. NIES-54]
MGSFTVVLQKSTKSVNFPSEAGVDHDNSRLHLSCTRLRSWIYLSEGGATSPSTVKGVEVVEGVEAVAVPAVMEEEVLALGVWRHSSSSSHIGSRSSSTTGGRTSQSLSDMLAIELTPLSTSRPITTGITPTEVLMTSPPSPTFIPHCYPTTLSPPPSLLPPPSSPIVLLCARSLSTLGVLEVQLRRVWAIGVPGLVVMALGVQAPPVEDTATSSQRPRPASTSNFPSHPQFPPCSPLQPAIAESRVVPTGGTGGAWGVGVGAGVSISSGGARAGSGDTGAEGATTGGEVNASPRRLAILQQ